LARRLVRGAVVNAANNLRYYSWRGQADLAEVLATLDHVVTHSLAAASSIAALMGWEGQAMATYFEAWGKIDPALTLGPRSRRPPGSPLNALLSFLHGLVYATCRHALSQTHLDPTLSVLHAPTQARYSLALDLAEPFKPAVAHRVLFRLVRRKMLTERDFEGESGAVWLAPSGREVVVRQFQEWLDTRVGQGVTYRQRIVQEAINLEAHVLGLRPYRPFVRKA
jgi:CRISPR-associated protein Cas1